MSWPTVSLPDAYWFQEGPGLRKWQFTSNGIKVLNVGNIMPDGSIDLSRTDRHVSCEEFDQKYQHFGVDAGDLVIASSGISFDEDGFLRTKVGFIEAEHLPLCMNTSTIRFKPATDEADLRYLKYWFQSFEFRQQVSQLVTGSAQLNFGPSHLKTMQITLPPIEEQKRIAAILDQADALRRLRQRAIDRLGSLEQAIFHEMFGDPNINPKSWPVKSFGECVENRDSLRIPVKQSDRDKRSGEYPYYGSVGIIDDIDDYLYEGEHLLVSEDGKHLESRSRPIACLADGKFWVNNHAHVVRDMGIADLVFLKAFLDAVSIKNHVSGIDQIKLNRKSMDKIPVPLPPRELQEEYRHRIQSLKSGISKMELAEESISKLFASLQSRAFRGEL